MSARPLSSSTPAAPAAPASSPRPPDAAPAALSLGYLRFAVRHPDRWTAFMHAMFGAPAPLRNDDGSLGWRLDGASQRLVVTRGDEDDLAALGLDAGDDATLDRLLERLRGAGHAPRAGTAAECAARRVARLHVVADPEGNAVELYTGLAPAHEAYASSAFAHGFHTRDGFGHAVLVTHDVPAMEAFYVGTLGFGVTERLATRVGPIEMRGTFLHCNRRHHSIALFDLPVRTRIHHFMVQAQAMHEVGLAFERARRARVPLSLTLGQHPDPDGTFSFYGTTPSGFDFEIGAGSGEIDPAAWQAVRTDVTSAWGHAPQLRLRLKMAAGLLASRLGRRRPPAAVPVPTAAR